MTSFLIAYINLQILFITLAFWYRFTKRKFSYTSMRLRKVLRLKLDPHLRFPEMVIKAFVLQVQSVDQTAHPPGALELQNVVSGPTPGISLGELSMALSILPPCNRSSSFCRPVDLSYQGYQSFLSTTLYLELTVI